ncbi:hypothetical protein DAI22_04g063800 [Oryza sativa Japonica Group]|nr:hypothetical protein DAI22_04g063800 [Oryza sativa Japonica Group]
MWLQITDDVGHQVDEVEGGLAALSNDVQVWCFFSTSLPHLRMRQMVLSGPGSFSLAPRCRRRQREEATGHRMEHAWASETARSS